MAGTTDTTTGACRGCGQLRGVDEYDARLWDLHDRRRDGRQHGEALVFTAEDFDDFGPDDDLGRDAIGLAMGRNMIERGLCSECGRPNLAGLGPDDFDSVEEARDRAAMEAEYAAERRVGA